MRHPIAVLVIFLLAGCASLSKAPGERVTDNFAAAWGCDGEEVRSAAAPYVDRPGADRIPQVGWSACEVLTATGTPTEVNRQQSESGRSATWWYHGLRGQVSMVTLEQRGSEWVVDYVGW